VGKELDADFTCFFMPSVVQAQTGLVRHSNAGRQGRCKLRSRPHSQHLRCAQQSKDRLFHSTLQRQCRPLTCSTPSLPRLLSPWVVLDLVDTRTLPVTPRLIQHGTSSPRNPAALRYVAPPVPDPVATAMPSAPCHQRLIASRSWHRSDANTAPRRWLSTPRVRELISSPAKLTSTP
jgi:hypothetical protein